MAQAPPVPTYRELTEEEARELFDELARRYLNMSGAEFLRAWDAGEFAADLEEERPEFMAVAFHLPLAR